ncbi:MAG: 23S rRNA (uracil-5-)-methyltransferase RumA, partial [Flavobacteriaceae bacterium]|nr:23S rRNA (uracil-5-)-methyltransferase RumA [Flavobacteriaceae bacterium]
MSRKKIDRVEAGLHVVDINAKGMGVAKNDEGVVYFIKDVIPGDLVNVQVYKKGR